MLSSWICKRVINRQVDRGMIDKKRVFFKKRGGIKENSILSIEFLGSVLPSLGKLIAFYSEKISFIIPIPKEYLQA